MLAIDFEHLLLSVPAVTVIGTWFSGGLGQVSAAEASQVLKSNPAGSLGVEEQDGSDYIVHIGGTKTWIVVTPDTPLYTELRRQYKQWLDKIRGE